MHQEPKKEKPRISAALFGRHLFRTARFCASSAEALKAPCCLLPVAGPGKRFRIAPDAEMYIP